MWDFYITFAKLLQVIIITNEYKQTIYEDQKQPVCKRNI